MKKLLTLALAVLGFTAAQALTLNWTANVTSDGTNKNDYPGWCGMFVVSGAIDSMNVNAFITTASPHEGDKTYDYDSTQLPAGSTLIAKLLINGETEYAQLLTTELQPAEISGSVDVGDYEAVTFILFNKSHMVSGSGSPSYVTVDGLADIETNSIAVDLGTINFQAGTKTTVTVPEPTVLALLALGVAGVALKRKKVVA